MIEGGGLDQTEENCKRGPEEGIERKPILQELGGKQWAEEDN